MSQGSTDGNGEIKDKTKNNIIATFTIYPYTQPEYSNSENLVISEK